MRWDGAVSLDVISMVNFPTVRVPFSSFEVLSLRTLLSLSTFLSVSYMNA